MRQRIFQSEGAKEAQARSSCILITENLLNELAKAGIDLLDTTKSYFLHEMKELLGTIFGMDAAELLIDRIREDLAGRE